MMDLSSVDSNQQTQKTILDSYKSDRFEIPSVEELTSLSFDNDWFPEELSPWFYLPSYAKLFEPLRRRYNQLYALGTSEVFAVFESDFVTPILLKKIKDPSLDLKFRFVVEAFCKEELKHAEMFHRLNRIAAGDLYKNSFLRLSRSASPARLFILTLMKSFPDTLGAWIWMSFFLEERSLMYSKAYLQEKKKDLSPAFRKVHMLHMLEENYHVQLDEVVIETFYRPLSQWKKKLSAWMLSKLVVSFMQPRRMSHAIAKILKSEFPNHSHEVDRCLQELSGLKQNRKFHEATLGKESTKRFRKMLSRFPEMSGVLKLLGGEV